MLYLTPLSYEKVKSESGIYAIRNLKNGKFYIGSTSCLKRRRYEHFLRLENGSHGNPHLLRSFQKYGRRAFEFVVVSTVLPGELIEAEQDFLDRLKPCDPSVGYNLNRLASGTRGELNGNARLTADQVRRMRWERVFFGDPYSEIAKRHGIAKKTAMSAINGRTWGHVGNGGVEVAGGGQGEVNPNAILSDNEVIKLRNRYASGESAAALADEIDVTRAVARRAITGRTYSHLPGAIILRRRKVWCVVEMSRPCNRPKGESHHRSKVTADDVRSMRRIRRKHGTPFAKIGKKFGLTRKSARLAIQGERWSHIEDVPPVPSGTHNNRARKLTDKAVSEIRRIYETTDLGYGRLAKRFDVSKATIRGIVKGITYQDVA